MRPFPLLMQLGIDYNSGNVEFYIILSINKKDVDSH
jgi:hypothetical protein